LIESGSKTKLKEMKIVGYFTYYKEISTGIISVVHKLYLFINTNVKLKKTKKKKDIF